ncbi:MAG: NAD(P)-dependent glycerol-3-phosphate dehydrogenase [Chthonomonas sp.]|nr:NAD(P)-dependent glycerol-3-phosphate dehydrogenase [Chthonomonas sp.]
MRIAVVGSGSWGTALAMILGRNGHSVLLLGKDPDEISMLRLARENATYLPGFAIPDSVEYGLVQESGGDCELAVLVTPSAAVVDVMRQEHLQPATWVVASKGLLPGTGAILTDFVTESRPQAKVAALSGPNLAVELARGIPTVAVAAAHDEALAEEVAHLFNSNKFRVYLSDDLTGVELSGALKNVYAITAGISDGLGFGDNTKGALIARALYEMTKVGVALGGRMETFFGIAGLGDLFATGVSKLSRNYRAGYGVGQGRALRTVMDEIGQVVEGVPTTEIGVRRVRQAGVQAPIMEGTHAVLAGAMSPRDGVGLLMDKLPKREGLGALIQQIAEGK